MTESPLIDSSFAVPVFSPGDDPIACLNKELAFLPAVASSRFPSTNNHLRTSSNPKNQATIQDGRVTVQQVQGRQSQSYSGTGYKSNSTSSRGNNTSRQARVVKCYNCQGKGHMARQCTQPKRPRNTSWYKEKAMLAEAQEAGQILDEEQLAFLADPGTEDLDTYDSDCDDLSNAQAVLMDNISSYGFDIISKVPHSETYLNDMENQDVQAVQDFEHIPVEKANKKHNNKSVTAELERYKERVKTFEQRLNVDLSSREKMIDSQMDDMIREKLALKEQVDSLEQNLSKQIKEKECLLQTFTVFKNESKEKEDKYMENEIDLEKKIKELDNILFKVGQSAQTVHMLTKPQAFYDNIHKQALGYQNPFHIRKAQRIKPTLYDGIVMSNKYVAMPMIDDEETLILEEESRSKMSEKTKDPEVINKKNSHKPIDYKKLNRLTDDFRKHFTPQQELSAEQAFWLRMSDHTSKPSDALPVKIEAPKELPKISLVNDSLKKLKFHLAKFDNAVKIRTIPNARTEEFFEKNDLKAQLQDKDSTICKLKDNIKSLREKSKEENVNYDYCEIETKNVDLENSVAKLLSENEHLCNEINHVKQVFKEQFDSIKQTRVRSKEHSDSLIDKLNLKSAENEDLKAQIQDKIDLEPLAPRLLQNREIHIEYLKYAQEQADILWGIVEQAKAKQPLDKELDFALHDNTFSGSKHEDANEHIKKVLEIVDLFHIPKVTQDQIMLRAFPVSLTGAASRWLRNQPSGSITTWEALKTTFLNKYCPPARTAKKMEEINNFQQEPDESLFRAWERFKELLMKCPHHYLTDMQEEMAEYSQKWHNGTSSRTRSTKTSDEIAAIQAQLNNLGREINKVNEKVYVAQVRYELCKGPHYTKDCPQKKEGKTLEEAYYIKFGIPYQPGGQYRAAGPRFYQQNNGNSSYPDRRPSLEESLTKSMEESAKRHEENSNIIKEIRASTYAAIRNQGALIKTLEIQIGQMSKVLQERGFGSLPSSTKTNPRDQVKLISTAKADFSEIRRIGHELYVVSGTQHTEAYFLKQSIFQDDCKTSAMMIGERHKMDKDEGKSHAETLIDIPIFVGSFSIISSFAIIDDDDMKKDVVLSMKFCKKYVSCQRIMKRFALGNNCERIIEDE
ncbi:retrovirus-related pol polyprotein from transposon TNT 1-94 [Tanacetum coccineum]